MKHVLLPTTLFWLIQAMPALGEQTPAPAQVKAAPTGTETSNTAPRKSAAKKLAQKKTATTRLASSEAAESGNAAPKEAAPPDAAAKDSPAPPTLSDLGQSVRSYFSEDEKKLIYDYLRDSAVAAFKGEEAMPMGPELAFKLEVLLGRMKKEGGAYMDTLSKQLEQDLKKRMAPPPPREYVPSRPFEQIWGGNSQQPK